MSDFFPRIPNPVDGSPTNSYSVQFS